MPEDHAGRKQPLFEDSLPTVNVVDDRFEQPASLIQTGLHLRPLGRRKNHRDQIELPQSLLRFLLAEYIECHAVVVEKPFGLRRATGELVERVAVEAVTQIGPMWTQRSKRRKRLVIDRGEAAIGFPKFIKRRRIRRHHFVVCTSGTMGAHRSIRKCVCGAV